MKVHEKILKNLELLVSNDFGLVNIEQADLLASTCAGASRRVRCRACNKVS